MAGSDYVLDANIIISLLIGGKATTYDFLQVYNFYSPDFVFNELDAYSERIKTKTKLSEVQLSQYSIKLFKAIAIVPRLAISEIALKKAEAYCFDIDPKDVAYVALSISTGFSLVTRDKVLYTGLRKKGFRSVLLFDELLASF